MVFSVAKFYSCCFLDLCGLTNYPQVASAFSRLVEI